MLVLGNLDHTAPHVTVGAADRIGNLPRRDAVALELRRIEVDLVLLDEPPDRGDLGDTVHPLKPVAKRPVLKGPELLEIAVTGGVHERVFENPSDTRRVGADFWRDPLRQAIADRSQVFEDARPRPVEIDPVLEDDVDERVADHGKSAHVLHAGGRAQRRDDGIGDLILDQVRASPHPLRRNDHLCVGEVRHRVERCSG